MRKIILVLLFLTVGTLFAQENINDYFPVVVGSKWLYANGSGKLSDIITVTNSTIDQKDGTGLYLIEHQIEGVGTTSTMYSTKGNKIVILVFKNALGRYTEYRQPYPVELAPAGQEWNYNDRGDNLRLKTTKASCSFDGKTYSDCILVEERIVSGNNVLRTKKSYYAKGIGLVYVTLQNAGERESVFMKLLEYSRLGNAQTNIKNKYFLLWLNIHNYDTANMTIGEVLDLYDIYIAKVSEKKIVFYIFKESENNWIYIPEIDFTLPTGCQDVFIYGNSIFVVMNNGLYMYFLNNRKWELDSHISGLPLIEYDRIIINGGIIIIAKNKRFFYNFENNNWEEIPITLFNLPSGYKNILPFGYNEYVVLTGNNTVKIYGLDNDGLIEKLSDWSFRLPDGGRDIIAYGDGDRCIGVIFDGYIRFYYRDKSNWAVVLKDFIFPF